MEESEAEKEEGEAAGDVRKIKLQHRRAVCFPNGSKGQRVPQLDQGPHKGQAALGGGPGRAACLSLFRGKAVLRHRAWGSAIPPCSLQGCEVPPPLRRGHSLVCNTAQPIRHHLKKGVNKKSVW